MKKWTCLAAPAWLVLPEHFSERSSPALQPADIRSVRIVLQLTPISLTEFLFLRCFWSEKFSVSIRTARWGSFEPIAELNDTCKRQVIKAGASPENLRRICTMKMFEALISSRFSWRSSHREQHLNSKLGAPEFWAPAWVPEPTKIDKEPNGT